VPARLPRTHPDADATREAVRAVEAVYRELEGRPATRNCTLQTGCCHFRLTGRIPYLTRGEALVAARALRAAGRRELPVRDDGACPLLHPETGRCRIYEGRPFGCRTHFCEAAGGPVARASVIDLIRRLETLDARLGGDGSRTLPVAVADALTRLPPPGGRPRSRPPAHPRSQPTGST